LFQYYISDILILNNSYTYQIHHLSSLISKCPKVSNGSTMTREVSNLRQSCILAVIRITKLLISQGLSGPSVLSSLKKLFMGKNQKRLEVVYLLTDAQKLVLNVYVPALQTQWLQQVPFMNSYRLGSKPEEVLNWL